MKFSIFSAALSLAAPALSAPATRPNRTTGPIVARNATVTASGASATQTLFPDLQVAWTSKYPNQLGRHTNRGHLLNSPSEQVHTAVHFDLKPANEAMWKGKTCKLVFRMSGDDAIVSNNGPAVFDIYRLNACLNEAYTWAAKPTRGVHAGILTPSKASWNERTPRAADWQSVDMSADTYDPFIGAAPTFSCQPGEYSFEMIARQGANIGWTSGRGSGLSIEICG